MKFEIKGVIHKVFEAKQVSERFTKREFVLSVEDGKYPQTVMFESSGAALEQLDGLTAGEEVTVHFNVRGREWTKPGTSETKYFNSLHAWKVELAESRKSSPSGNGNGAPPADLPPSSPADDDCPV